MSNVVLAEERSPATIYDVFAQMARDPSIDPARIAALMELQIKAEERNAEKEFNAAFARVLPKMPRITKRGTIDMGAKGSMKFARYEDLDAAIRPIYTADGFALSFSSRATDKGIILVGILKHQAGHTLSPAPELQLPPDAGAGRNSLQALGSSLSYAKRYLTCDIFNIVTQDQDDDGAAIGFVDETQANKIIDMVLHVENTLGKKIESGFLKFMGAKSVSEIHKRDYSRAMTALNDKLKEAK